jgi:glycosyltransferase involved in cell wall biosynthesis
MSAAAPLRILHCFRSPVGGIFRHVRDLAAAQKAAGHSVGILCDSSTGGEYEERLFEAIRPTLDLGLTRIPMKRAVTPGDLLTLWKTMKEISVMRPDVVHSHGAKGGAYARIIATILNLRGSSIARLYCPHGGSIHYDGGSVSGKLYFAAERFLERMSDRLVFVSQYERDGYAAKVGEPRCPTSLVYNGLSPEEFEPVAPGADAADFLYIGMMRDLKGCDLFLEAMRLLRTSGRNVRAHFVGDGPDKPRYEAFIADNGLGSAVTVHAPMPARKAFELARIVVVPSRAESMPYLVLEAAAAGRPLVAANVGGIPEILAQDRDRLVAPGDAEALAAAMASALDDGAREEHARLLVEDIRARFSVSRMAADVEAAYRETIASRTR